MDTTKGKSALGRGLEALIGGIEPKIGLRTPDEGAGILELDVRSIKANPFQPRTDFDHDALDALRLSIQQNGIIQPLTVRRSADGSYELVAGERRLRAAVLAGFRTVPVRLISVETNEQMLELALVENLQREDLNPIEEAVSYQRLIDDCRLTHEQISEKIGKERSTVTNSLRLLKLPAEIRESLRAGEISAGHARAILAKEKPDEQLGLWKQIVSQGLNVRQAEQISRTGTDKKLKKKKAVVIQMNPAGLDRIESRLKSTLGTQVRIAMKKSGAGSIVIEFYGQNDLERLIDLLESKR